MTNTLLDAALSGATRAWSSSCTCWKCYRKRKGVLPSSRHQEAVREKTRAEDGATPLYIAASQGNIVVMNRLLGATATLLAYGKHKSVREVLCSACKNCCKVKLVGCRGVIDG